MAIITNSLSFTSITLSYLYFSKWHQTTDFCLPLQVPLTGTVILTLHGGTGGNSTATATSAWVAAEASTWVGIAPSSCVVVGVWTEGSLVEVSMT